MPTDRAAYLGVYLRPTFPLPSTPDTGSWRENFCKSRGWGTASGVSGKQQPPRPSRKQNRPQVHEQRARDQQQRYPYPLEHRLQPPPRGSAYRLVQSRVDLRTSGRAKAGTLPSLSVRFGPTVSAHSTLAAGVVEFIGISLEIKKPRPRREAPVP
jgi:hypothetical protein